ncbi:aldehyde dehydrogenase, partial [Candidatus Dojkabacteria bacterium]|nr:aldehyde dehydrogenase [Candidatus Dojkabacteria bacterium]
MAKLISINPSNYKEIGEVEITTPEELARKIQIAHEAKVTWRNTPLQERIQLLRAAFIELGQNKKELAEIQSKEMGIPINDALYDVDDSINFANWYFDNAEKYLAPEITYEDEKVIHYVVREPIGVAAVILPWNFPFANVIWGALQSLVVGNVVIMKHSEECPLSSQLITKIIHKHLPEGVFDAVYGDGKLGDLLTSADIDLIALTGSTKVGKYLYEKAGKKFIKAVMELGGSAPGIIFDDADLDIAINNVCDNRLFNSGQCCDGLKRLIVHESLQEEVLERLKAQFEGKKIGDALDEETNIGPLVAKRQLETVIDQVEDAVNKGAEIITGGNSLEEKLGGAFYEPTILKNVNLDMRVMQEEVFAPVLPIITFSTEEEAIELANNTSYGLGAYLFTNDSERIERMIQRLESGMVSVNGVSYIKPFNPFGGYKYSGIGREHGRYGFEELTQIKVIAKKK